MNSNNKLSDIGSFSLNEELSQEDSNVQVRVKTILGKIMEYTETKKSALKKLTTAKKSAQNKENINDDDYVFNYARELNFN